MPKETVNPKEIFDLISTHSWIKRLPQSFGGILGDPVWWIIPKNGARGHNKSFIEHSHELWGDPRVRGIHKKFLEKTIFKKSLKNKKPLVFIDPHQNTVYAIPFFCNDRLIGFVGASGVRADTRKNILELLVEHVGLIIQDCLHKAEINRLSATIKPRAIALSTVHTVHRIINSTLNLDELISRLAHLTAQVLRVNRCAIYLVEKSQDFQNHRSGRKAKQKIKLICKALVGYQKNQNTNKPASHLTAIEYSVAGSANIVFRKKMICIPLIDEDLIGVLTITNKKDKSDFNYFDQEILTTLAEEAVIAIKNAQLYEEQKKVTLGTIRSLAAILGSRVPSSMPPEIFLKLVLKVSEDLKLSDDQIQALHYATLLKDTAKAGIPDNILRKRSKLTGEEYRLLRDHPIQGAKIVQSFESLKPVAPIILYSREKFDGTGYPEGLSGENIPIGARILSIVTAFEAIIFGRPYRDQSSFAEALDEIRRNSGSQFDPRIVEVFIRVAQDEGFEKFLKNQ